MMSTMRETQSSHSAVLQTSIFAGKMVIIFNMSYVASTLLTGTIMTIERVLGAGAIVFASAFAIGLLLNVRNHEPPAWMVKSLVAASAISALALSIWAL
ncbi:hypothetical protein FLK61_26825 [Paenalkalicoccus suaedae]|uniref:Uncharacterized protein n=1 Tax=Paenalkalicoccus suaedae TaxID=2592382 RepID=A0A859FC87_9BACI|nr:hypothetical protein [Paenalkalicoccus suaedae]QKS70371.1 hypothetical protein FLK61_26825 [Paenalkalicoccus suaedae]